MRITSYKLFGWYTVYDENGEDETRVVKVALDANHRRKLKKVKSYSSKRALRKELQYIGIIPKRFTCDCSHCMADRDCCGNLFPSHCNVHATKYGLRIETTYTRNL